MSAILQIKPETKSDHINTGINSDITSGITSEKGDINLQINEAAYTAKLTELEGAAGSSLTELQKKYLSLDSVKRRVIKCSIEDLPKAINDAIAETAPEQITQLSSMLIYPLPSEYLQKARLFVENKGVSPNHIIEGIRSDYLKELHIYFWDVLELINNEYYRFEDFPIFVEIYKKVVASFNHSPFRAALDCIRNGITPGIMLEGIRLGLREKLNFQDSRYSSNYNSSDDLFFIGITLISKGRIKFDDLIALSRYDIEVMYADFAYSKETVFTLDFINTLKAHCPLNAADSQNLRSHDLLIGNPGSFAPTLKLIAKLNRDQRDFYWSGFSQQEALELTSQGITFNSFKEMTGRDGLFSEKGFKYFFLDTKKRAEIFKLLPQEAVPKAALEATSSLDAMSSFVGFSLVGLSAANFTANGTANNTVNNTASNTISTTVVATGDDGDELLEADKSPSLQVKSSSTSKSSSSAQ